MDDEPTFCSFYNATNPWHITVAVNGVAVPFCIDTGAEVTVIPAGVTMNDPACVRERGREGMEGEQ